MKEIERDIEIRRTNLNILVDKFKTQRELADLLDQTPGYLNQLLNGYRSIGEKTARKIEIKIGLKKYLLDSYDTQRIRSLNKTKLGFIQAENYPEKDLAEGNGNYQIIRSLRRLPKIKWLGVPTFLNSTNTNKEFEMMQTNKVKVSDQAFMIEFNSNIYADYIKTGETIVIDPATKPAHMSAVLVEIKGQYHILRYECIDLERLYPVNGTQPVSIDENTNIVGPVVWIMSGRPG